ncbi:ATP-dependent DNA helicase RecQ [Chitinophagaceae bacterium LWZ2-11]
MSSPSQILKQYWGYDSFRGAQEQIINNVLEGKDVLALLPTGGGKSVCFQVPGLMKDGVTLVISPLIALMKDQVEGLLNKGISALMLHSGMTYFEVEKALRDAVYGEYKFLYVSPERLESDVFKAFLPELNITLIAVDEAHCISQWGYDFRPPYLRIAATRKELPGVPVIALTASATPQVQEDIVEKLLFKEKNIFVQSFEKPNLSYSVFHVDSKINKVVDILKGVPGTGIVYCRNRRQTKNVAELLSMQQISADYYHAGLTQEERNRKQSAWINNQTRVIVCTNAFGMGIDKPEVRTVIHYDSPDCLENYYQEAGRAGRDGKKAYAVLLYQQEDLNELNEMPDLRYPELETIRKVYQALADFLQIPVGIGEGTYHDFDLTAFVKNFDLDSRTVVNTLKVLEQEGHLAFSENIFLPARVMFTVYKTQLEDFETAHPDLEPIIKCLLRTYEGIYDNSVSVFERQIAKLLRLPSDLINKQLLQLQAFGIIQYLPQKETPQIKYLLNRAQAEYLHIDSKAYFARKKQYQIRVAAMLQYLALVNECRSRHLSAYFGDKTVKDCQICDNCLRKKVEPLTETEFKNISDHVYNNIPDNGILMTDLLQSLKMLNKEKLWEVLLFLKEEREININEAGLVSKT